MRSVQNVAMTGATLVLSTVVAAQNGGADLWSDIPLAAIPTTGLRDITPRRARTLTLDPDGMMAHLNAAPMEFAGAPPLTTHLPMPDGTSARFAIVEAPIMEPALAVRYPSIRTYVGTGIDDPAATVRLDATPQGLHAMVRSPRGVVFIDPYQRSDNTSYICYDRRDFVPNAANAGVRCQGDAVAPMIARAARRNRLLERRDGHGDQSASGGSVPLRTYRLAMACTGEYAAFHGGTVPLAMAAIVTAVNRVTGIYENEVGIRFVLVANNDQIVFTDAFADPYENVSCDFDIEENQFVCDDIIGPANYDIGHVMGTGGGGLAGPGPCDTGFNANGCTGLDVPIGDPFVVDFVAHEIGHQFGADHTWSGDDLGGGACNSDAWGGLQSSLEPASGSTIMGYAGICPPLDLQPNSDPYFHARSHDQINAYSEGIGNCAQLMFSTNTAPVVDAGVDGVTIPMGTPFTKIGSATDADFDPLTYTWEQFDPGPETSDPTDCAYTGSIFRSFAPSADPQRTFPRLEDILDGTPEIGEVLPCISRTLTFRLTARDNQVPGGVASAVTTMNVDGNSGPFIVTAPMSGAMWPEGSTQMVQWDVAGTAGAPVSAGTVDIRLSLDGGLTFPTVLAANTANDGAEPIMVPAGTTTTARVKVEAILSVSDAFFNVSPSFMITKGASCPQDLDGSGEIDFGDLLAIILAWNQTSVPEDLDGSGLVDFADILVVIVMWGPCP